MDLSQRQDMILALIVESFIQTGEPVGSKHLSRSSSLNVSSATIRNDMAVLYDLGYLEQPHTSAGRVPSHIGFRRYVDTLMPREPLTSNEKNYIDSLFNVRSSDPDKLLKDAAYALSDFTGYASITSSLIEPRVRIRKLEFVAAGENTIVIVLITSSGMVRSKVSKVRFPINAQILEFLTVFCNSHFAGRSIESISKSYIKSLSYSLGEQSLTFAGVMVAIYELCLEITEGEYYVSGSSKLLRYSDELGRLAADLLMLIDDKNNLNKLFGPNILDFRILIGKENSAVELTGSSVLVTRYFVADMPAGTVGLVGPMRLNYCRVIPQLDYFASTLGSLMDDLLESDGDQKQL